MQRYANPPTGKVGFVSATQIPAGGYETLGDGVIGDFNGDGKPDDMTVEDFTSYSMSVVLAGC